jgi:hypothetical protein
MKLQIVTLIKNKNNLINIGVLILALIIAKNIYSHQIKKIDVLKNDKNTELKKSALINDISLMEKRINAYKIFFYKKDPSTMINNITRIAGESQIKITSVRPEGEKEHIAYNKISARFNMVAPDYHRLGSFISKLESAPEHYIIDYFLISVLSPVTGKGNIDRLSAELTVNAIIFKD